MEPDKIRLSIIIPMYQASKHIYECINSVIKQNIKPIEIICINDGSTDQTADIVSKIMDSDSRVKLLHTNHMGVSHARNLGINKAEGNYLLFLDSDDRLLPGKLSQTLNKAEKKKADILIFSGTTNMPYSTPLWIRDAFSAPNKFYPLFSPELLIQEKSCRPSACNKLYRRQYILSNHYYFPSDLPIAEDHVFQFLVFPKAKNITFCRTRLYYYQINHQDSTMTYYGNNTALRMKNHLNAMNLVAKFWNDEGYLKESSFQKIYLTSYLDLLFDDLFQLPFDQRSSYVKEIYTTIIETVDCQSVANPIDKRRLKILELYYKNKFQECDQLLKATSTSCILQRPINKLLGPIRYLQRVGIHSTIEHYIGKILHIEP